MRGICVSPRGADRLVILGLALATVVVCLPLVLRPRGLMLGPSDLETYYSLAACDYLSVDRFGQFPFRSQYCFAGFPVYVHPHDFSLSPRMPLILAFGPWAGVKLDYLITTYLAAVGMYLLVRRQMGCAVPAAVVSALAFAFGGFLLMRWLTGWLINCRAAVLPWVLYFWWRSRRDARWLIPCGLIMATLLLDGKYSLAVLAWFMVLWMVLRLDRTGGGRAGDRLQWRRFLVLGAVLLWAFLLAGVKLVPFGPVLWEYRTPGGQPVSWRQVTLWVALFGALAASPVAAGVRPRRRAVAASLGLLAAALLAVILVCPPDDSTLPERLERGAETFRGLVDTRADPDLARDGETPICPVSFVSPVGWVGAVLAVAAVVWRRREVGRLAILAGLLLLIDLGPALPRNLMASVHGLPGINAIRKPRAWLNMYLVFCLAVLAGRGAMLPLAWLRRRWSRFIPWGLVGASLFYYVWIAWPSYWWSVGRPLPKLGLPEPDYHVVSRTDSVSDYPAFLMYKNRCVLDWPLDLNHPRLLAIGQWRVTPDSPTTKPGYRGEAYFLGLDSPNEVELPEGWLTPLEIRLKVHVRERDVLCINQIHDVHQIHDVKWMDWRAEGGQVDPAGFLLRVWLDPAPEPYEVRLRYRPTLFYWGLGVSLAALAGGLAVILSGKRCQVLFVRSTLRSVPAKST